ncbi:hypothetical protein SAMN02787073_5120 [Chryseobacterium vrystaatense]|uniref:Lipoprotein n=2 Tax=Chryseobacterium vrystaatense TaxID=307480 RepID=A0A1M5NZZ9_9FLAO|nr:hypothetical protein IW16_11570 [Chryseobacterium vrystaatense]SHG94759.1 hypothetical protein SAMN02787073_5120 [Chryseobacterium vrystaatense]
MIINIMRKTSITLLLLSLFFFSCQQQKKEEDIAVKDEDIKSPEELIKPFFADNYPVTENMFGKATSNRPVITAHLRSENTAWFTNDSLQQSLLFILFSDNSRLVTACFDNNNIPGEVFSKMDFSDNNNYPSSEEDRLLYYKEFFKSAKKIDKKYFISNMGFQIGDAKEKAIAKYGKPDSIKTAEGFEKYYWNPAGAQITQKNVPEKNLLLIDEKKQFITMYFKNNKLATMILDNTPRSEP